jgi:hypothetical protein
MIGAELDPVAALVGGRSGREQVAQLGGGRSRAPMAHPQERFAHVDALEREAFEHGAARARGAGGETPGMARRRQPV